MMVMPFGLVKTTCLDCGWSCTTNQKTDVLVLPKTCKKCGGERLKLERVGVMNILQDALLFLKK
jgi:hypothetical protein